MALAAHLLLGVVIGALGFAGPGRNLQDDHPHRARCGDTRQDGLLDRRLKLNGRFPDRETQEKIWDNLDRSRALQAYLLAIPIVNQAGMRDSLLKFGPVNSTDVIWENLVDPKTVELTANDNTIYSFIWIDTKGTARSWSRFRPRCSGRSMTSGTSGWSMSASPAPTRVRAGNT